MTTGLGGGLGRAVAAAGAIGLLSRRRACAPQSHIHPRPGRTCTQVTRVAPTPRAIEWRPSARAGRRSPSHTALWARMEVAASLEQSRRGSGRRARRRRTEFKIRSPLFISGQALRRVPCVVDRVFGGVPRTRGVTRRICLPTTPRSPRRRNPVGSFWPAAGRRTCPSPPRFQASTRGATSAGYQQVSPS